MEFQGYSKIQLRLGSLLNARRLKFPLVDPDTGHFKWKHMLYVLFNTLGDCLNFPVLFYMSFYFLVLYPGYNLRPLDMISVVFYSAAFSIFLDVFIGFLFDKLIKPNQGDTPRSGIITALSIIGTIGLVVTLAFFFRTGVQPAEAILQYRMGILFSSICLTLANLTNVKNSMNYTPSQDGRMRIFNIEYLIKALIILLYVCIPLWAKINSTDCECQDICRDKPHDPACLGCLNTCDTFTGDQLDYFRVTSIVFTSIFGAANILAKFFVRTRNDEDREDISTTFNRRMNEFFSNIFLVRTFFISLLEYTIVFGFAIWAYYFITQDTVITQGCIDRLGHSAYMCTKSFFLQLVVFLMFISSFYTFLISTTKPYISYVSIITTVLVFIAGILIIIIRNDDTTMFCFIAVFMAIFFGTLAANKLIYSSGVFYDEYKSGNSQAHLPSSIYLLTIKLGFLFALAFHLALLKTEGLGGDQKHTDQKGYGIFVVVASLVILLLKVLISSANVQAFDKIQIAIERNNDLQEDDIAFYDPITKEPLRHPVTSYHLLEKKFIKLMYNLKQKDMVDVINGLQQSLRTKAIVRIVIHCFFIVISTVLLIFFARYFSSNWAWLVAVPLFYIPFAIMAIIYEYNVVAAAGYAESAKYKNVDRDVLLRFSLIVEGLH